MVQTPFIPFGDAPEDAVHEAVRFRQDGGNADPAAVFTESKAVSFQPTLPATSASGQRNAIWFRFILLP